MGNKLLLILILLLLSVNIMIASDSKKTFAVGLTGGLSQKNYYSGDLYGGIVLPAGKTSFEANVGYTSFANETSYQGIHDLKFNSHGVFMEGNYFMIKGLYCGLRLALNLNHVTKASQAKFDNYSNIKSPTTFFGQAVYGQVGYYQSLGERFGIKIQGQIGFHNYKISQGWMISSGSDSSLRDEQHGIERHGDFLHNISIGLVLNL